MTRPPSIPGVALRRTKEQQVCQGGHFVRTLLAELRIGQLIIGISPAYSTSQPAWIAQSSKWSCTAAGGHRQSNAGFIEPSGNASGSNQERDPAHGRGGGPWGLFLRCCRTFSSF